jgi:hypothetical protein
VGVGDRRRQTERKSLKGIYNRKSQVWGAACGSFVSDH